MHVFRPVQLCILWIFSILQFTKLQCGLREWVNTKHMVGVRQRRIAIRIACVEASQTRLRSVLLMLHSINVTFLWIFFMAKRRKHHSIISKLSILRTKFFSGNKLKCIIVFQRFVIFELKSHFYSMFWHKLSVCFFHREVSRLRMSR